MLAIRAALSSAFIDPFKPHRQNRGRILAGGFFEKASVSSSPENRCWRWPACGWMIRTKIEILKPELAGWGMPGGGAR
jgi:hypothetical protein